MKALVPLAFADDTGALYGVGDKPGHPFRGNQWTKAPYRAGEKVVRVKDVGRRTEFGDVEGEILSVHRGSGAGGVKQTLKVKWSTGVVSSVEDRQIARIEEARAKGKYSSARPLYIRRDVTNAEQIREWAKAQGFDTLLEADDMHVTIARSRTPVDWDLMRDSNEDDAYQGFQVLGGTRVISHLGDKGAIVLKFMCQAITQRWQELIDRGCSWDWDSFHPHITLTYANPDGLDPSKIDPYPGVIVLGPEKMEELDEDWADGVTENVALSPFKMNADEGGVWRTIRGRKVFIKDGESMEDALKRDLEGKGGPDKSSEIGLTDLKKKYPEGTHENVGPLEVKVFRVGPLKDNFGRGIFFGDSAESIKDYKGLHGDADIKEYTVRAKNAIVTESQFSLHKHFFGKSLQDATHSIEKRSGFKTTSIEAFRQVEKKLAARARSLGHDVIVYTKPPAPAKVEISVIGKGALISGEGDAKPFDVNDEAEEYEQAKELFDELRGVARLEKANKASRKFTEEEPLITINYALIRRSFDRLENESIEQLHEVLTSIRDALIKKIASSDDANALVRDLKLPYQRDLHAAIEEMLRRAWEAGNTAASRELTQQAMVATYGDWDESKHPRHPAGDDKGGEFAPVYHGTSSAVAESIKQKGLLPKFLMLDRSSGKYKKGVWLTTSKAEAEHYASLAPIGMGSKKALGGEPVIVTVRVPKAEFSKMFKPDPDFPRVTPTADFRFGRVPAEWIHEIRGVKSGKVYAQELGGEYVELYGVVVPEAEVVYAALETYSKQAFTPRAALSWLKSQAITVAGVLSDKLLGDVKMEIMNGIRTGRAMELIASGLMAIFLPYLGDPDVIDDGGVVEPHRLETIVRTNITTAYNHGRLTEYVKKEMIPFLNGVRYSAILDTRTTEVCRFLDGKVFKPTDPDLESLLPPNHYNCRSIVVPIVVGSKIDAKDFITPAQAGQAKELAQAKFLEAKGLWKHYQEEFAYNPDQARKPKGDPEGGQWTDYVPLTRAARESMTPEELEEYRRKARERARRRREKRRGEAEPESKSLMEIFGNLPQGVSPSEQDVERMLKEHAEKPTHKLLMHGMPKHEEFHKIMLAPGVPLFYHGEDYSGRATATAVVRNWYHATKNDLMPPELAQATRGVVLSNQPNKQDAITSQRIGKTFISAATGGDGWIVGYRGTRLRGDDLAHESAHNLATQFWGTPFPPQSTRWGKLWADYKAGTGPAPLTDYGKTNIAEALATTFERLPYIPPGATSPWVVAAQDMLGETRRKLKMPEKT